MARSPSLDRIYQQYSKYEDDENFVFVSFRQEWIIVLSKLDETQTNEMREDIVNLKYAKCRADILKVVLIFNKYEPEIQLEKIDAYLPIGTFSKDCTYTVGRITRSPDFDTDINKVIGEGIQYYKSLEVAYYADSMTYHGLDRSWYSTGTLQAEWNRKYGVLDGFFRCWYLNGQIEKEMNYRDGKIVGSYKKWDHAGMIVDDCFLP